MIYIAYILFHILYCAQLIPHQIPPVIEEISYAILRTSEAILSVWMNTL